MYSLCFLTAGGNSHRPSVCNNRNRVIMTANNIGGAAYLAWNRNRGSANSRVNNRSPFAIVKRIIMEPVAGQNRKTQEQWLESIQAMVKQVIKRRRADQAKYDAQIKAAVNKYQKNVVKHESTLRNIHKRSASETNKPLAFDNMRLRNIEANRKRARNVYLMNLNKAIKHQSQVTYWSWVNDHVLEKLMNPNNNR
jgi:hypothetical protein